MPRPTSSMAFSGVVHLDPTNPDKIFNPDTGRYVFMDGEIGQSILRKYGNNLRTRQTDDSIASGSKVATKSIDYDALDIIQNQISQYKEYVAKEPYHEAAEMINNALTEVQKSFNSLQGLSISTLTSDKIKSIIEELIEIFNALQEHGFKIGRAKYPGPNAAWKNLLIYQLCT